LRNIVLIKGKGHDPDKLRQIALKTTPLTDDLIRIETALFVRKDQMHASVKDFIAVALSGIGALKLNPLEKH
jgi:hypothetical protein